MSDMTSTIHLNDDIWLRNKRFLLCTVAITLLDLIKIILNRHRYSISIVVYRYLKETSLHIGM